MPTAYKQKSRERRATSLERRFEATRRFIDHKAGSRSLPPSGLTELGEIHLSRIKKFDDEGKNYAWCGRLIRWMAILYDSQIKHERVLEGMTPLFFVDLDRIVGV